MAVELSADEAQVVLELLESAHSDLREEIYKTEDTDFKRRLKEREAALEGVLKKIRAAVGGE